MKTINIDGVAYIEASAANLTTNTEPIKIVIGDRGWVFVGRLSEHSDHISLTGCSVIRRWGTTNGLGEIALAGPTDDTVLDDTGRVHVYRTAVIAVIDCNEAAWTPHVS